MKKILFGIFFALLQFAALSQTPFTAPWGFNYAAPTGAPSALGTRVRFDITTGRIYTWSPDALNWQLQGYTIDQISGTSAPAYTPVRGQSWFAVNGDTLPRLYQYTGTGTVWKCLNCSDGKTYTAGEGVNIYGNTIQVDTLDRLSFATSPTLPGGVGTIRWNDTDGCLEYGMKGGNIVQQIGLEQLTLVKHADNTGLALGKVVYFVGSDGANKTVRYAQANAENTSANTFGIMAESVAGGGKAFCTTFGLVEGLNTLSLSEGRMVWLSESSLGDMTTTRPTAPNHAVQIGYCIRSHATQGVIFVSVQNGYELEELHNVSSTAPASGQVLKWGGTTWRPDTDNNTTYTAGTGIAISGSNVISNTGDLSNTNELQNLSLTGQSLGITSGTGVTLPITDVVAGTGVTVSKASGAATVNSTGITALTGDVTASGPGSAAATIAAGAVTGAKLATGAVSDSTKLGANVIEQSNIDNGAVWARHIARMGASAGQVLGWNGSVWGPTTITSGWGLTGNAATAGSSFLGTTNNTSLRFRTNNVQRMIVDSLGNLGIGTTNPTERLKIVAGNIEIDAARRYRWADGSFLEGGGTSNLMTIRSLGNFLMQGSNLYLASSAGVPAAKLHVVGSGATSSTWTAQFHNSSGTNNALMLRDDGWVGMGTATSGSDVIDIQAKNSSQLLGSEFATTGSGTNWTGTSFALGYTHTPGSVEPLVGAFTVNTGWIYAVTYVITARTAGTFNVTMGGLNVNNSGPNGTYTLPQSFTKSTAALTITPTSDFDGTVTFTVKRVTIYPATIALKNNTGSVSVEIRVPNLSTNTFMGRESGGYAASDIGEKTGYGYYAIGSSTRGSAVTGIGAYAAYVNTIGSQFVAIGSRAAANSTTGSSFVATGYQAANANTTGSNYTATGFRAGFNNTIYDDWIAIGRNAAPQVHFQNGIYIGGGVAATEGIAGTPTTNEIVIGHLATGKGSNTVQLGNATTTTQSYIAGQIVGGGIAINNNTDILTLHNASNAYGSIYGNGNTGLRLYNSTTNPNNSFQFYTSKGTTTAPTLVAASDNLGSIDFRGHDGATYRLGAGITSFAEGTPGTGTVPTSLRFNTTSQGIGAYSERMRITQTGSVLIGTTTDNLSSALTVQSTSKGFLPPRMTADQASAIASPAEGLMVYVTNTNGTFTSKGWWGYNGASWEKLNN